MTYKEYGNNKEYKISILNKKYFFRDAIKLYSSSDDNNIQSSLDQKSSAIIEIILLVIKEIDFELDNKKRIIFNMSVIIALAGKDYLGRYSKLTFNMIEFYKKKGIISKYSKSFPLVHKDYDSNRLTKCFTVANYNRSDTILDIADELLDAIRDMSNEKHELYLFYYMRVFSIKNYSQEVFENFYRSNIYNLDGTIVLIYKKKHSDTYSSVEVVYFDKELNHALVKAFFNQSHNLFDKIDHYFEKPFVEYDKQLQKFLKNIYTRVTYNDLTNYSQRYFKNLIKQIVELDYQLKNTPLQHTLKKEVLYPHTNYLELLKLFPEIINNEYKNIEIENIKQQQKITIIEEEEIEEIDVKDYLKLNLNDWDEFRKFKQYSKSTIKNKKEHDAYITRLDKFILKHRDTFSFPKIFYYVKHIVNMSKFNKESDKKLAVKTIYDRLCILFAQCFNIILQEGRIDLDVQELIKSNIENYIHQDTKNIYYTAINPFLDLYDYAINYKSSKNIRYARKSLIFKTELDKLYEVLIELDEEYYNINSLLQKNKFITHQRFVFCMLLYYSGLRESEMWSRTTKDIYIDGDTVVIDVNKNDQIKSFKTFSARRRVEFTIDDEKYFNIFKVYLQYLEINNHKHLYPAIDKSKKIAKKDIQQLYFLVKCSDELKKITGRYVTLHSFRHTYITKTIRALVKSNQKEKKDFYNIVNMAGHLGPEVTLRYYAHIDYILYYHNIEHLF